MKIGVGVIGLGYAGAQHLDAYLNHPDVEVKMICAQHADKHRAVAELHGLPFTTDFRDVMKDDAIGLVSICTPDHLHTEPALAAIEAGKAVFCEKPLATTLDDCHKIVDAAEKADVKFLTGQILRFAPLFRSLRKIYASGAIGDAVFAESDYLHDIGFLLGGWRSDPTTNWDLTLAGGCHPIDLLRWIVGEIDEVHARANKLCLTELPMPADNILLSLNFSNGAIGKVQLTGGSPRPYALNFAIHGTKGTLVNNRLFTQDIDELEDFIELPLPQEEEFPYYDREVDDLVQAITNDAPPSVSALDGARSVAVCLAGIESAAKKVPVKVTQF